jgi:hypothetical protein
MEKNRKYIRAAFVTQRFSLFHSLFLLIEDRHMPPASKAEQQQTYIRKHQLAGLVDVLLQQLLVEKPQQDPLLWLADRVAVERALRAKGRSLAPCLNGGC